MTNLYGSLEAGGTKFICAVADEDFNTVEELQFPTTTPQETLKKTADFFAKFKNLAAIGIGSFGPIDVDPKSKTYGYITTTPKPNWANVDVVGALKKRVDVPIYFTTDVNSSAYGEVYARNNRGENIETLVYYTIGTGIGAGVIQRGEFIGGTSHPEMGHVYVSKHPIDVANNFDGVCPFHKGCLEGLAAGPSLEARTGVRGEHIDIASDVWDVQASYIAQAAIQATLTFRPEKIVFGGGVMAQNHMVERVHRMFEELLNGYVPTPPVKDFIVTPAVDNNGSATLGNYVLAKSLVQSVSNTTTTSTSTTVSQTTLQQIDRTKWSYNETDNVYYQIGISYAGNQVDENQTLSVFIPGEYMTATANGDGTYTADLNGDAKIGDYTAATAPVVMPINTPGYSKMNALTEYTSKAATYTKEGFIYMSAGLRGRDTGAPNGVVDAKAAIRYLRSNTNYISSTNPFYVFGMSGGGAQSAIIGASGDSELYTSYLNEIGAISTTSDAVDGVMAWCPITNLDVADAAYEWNLGSARTGLDTESQTLSNNLATQFAEYMNKLQLKDSEGNVLTLQSSTEGIYQSGTYYEYIKEVIETSLEHFLADTTFPYDASKSSNKGGPGGGGPGGGTPPSGEAPSGNKPSGGAPGNSSSSGQTSSTDNASSETTSIEQVDKVNRQQTSSALSLTGTYNSVEEYIAALNTNKTWVTYDSTTKKVTITSVADFVSQLKSPSKSLTAFDALDESQAENQLFGSNGEGSHFDSILANLLKGTSYEAAFTEDASTKDSQGNTVETRVQMYNPMYYLTSYYEGNKTSTVAKNWRIRTGINQGDTALSTEVNLALELQQYGGLTVDFETIWGQGHTEAERTGESSTNFINWVKENTK